MIPDTVGLSAEFKRFLSLFPLLSDKFILFLYSRNGTLLFQSDSLKLYTGINTTRLSDLQGLFHSEFVNDSFNVDFFPDKIFSTFTTLKLNPRDTLSIKADLAEYHSGVPCIINIAHQDGLYLAMLHPLFYFIERFIGRITPDMLAILGQNNQILYFCNQLKSVLYRETEGPLFLDAFTEPAKWRQLLEREPAIKNTFQQWMIKCESRAWTLLYDLNSMPASSWIEDIGSIWTFSPERLFASNDKSDHSFITFMQPFNQNEQDVRIEMVIETEHFISLGICLNINIYNAQNETGWPDLEGYHFQLARLYMKPLDPLILRLKKDGRIIHATALSKSLTSFFNEKTVRLAFERSCGGVFRFFINDMLGATLFDYHPIVSEHCHYFSLASTCGIRIHHLAIHVRPTEFLPDQLLPETEDLIFYRLPGRIFETQVTHYPGEWGGLSHLRYVFMRDVTESRELTKNLKKTIKEIEDELNIARRIQTHWANAPLPDSSAIRFTTFFRPCGKVGGDMLDIKELDDNRFALLIYDVTGHSIVASLISAMGKMSFENAFKRTQSPKAILQHVNEDICSVTDPTIFITAFLCVIDLEKAILTYSRAGHCIPALFSLKRPHPILLEKGGPVLGNSIEFDFPEYQIKVEEGDRLLLYTDGIIEARDTNNQLFERHRLFNVLQETLSLPIEEARDRIVQAAVSFNGSDQFEDDTAVILADILKTGRTILPEMI